MAKDVSSTPSNAQDPEASGTISLGNLVGRAVKNDREAIEALFAGFLGEREAIRDCGYLGVIGFIFPNRSFWCITDKRICALLIRRGGRVQFTSGFVTLINSMMVRQPSLVLLWVVLILWVAFVALITYSMIVPFTDELEFQLLINFGISFIPWWLMTGVFAAFLLLFTRFLSRLYFRFFKTGCTFWMRENIPINLFADRHNIGQTQKLVKRFTDEKSFSG